MMTEDRFKETAYKMSYEEYKKCYCPECTRKIAFTEMHIEDYQKLMVVLIYVQI